MRVIEISKKDGILCAENEHYLSDFTIEPGYLFSVAIENRTAKIFRKDYKFTKNTFKGKYYITLTHKLGELSVTDDYDSHVNHNILDAGYNDYVSFDYANTLIIDMDKKEVKIRNEDSDFWHIIKENKEERIGWQQHINSFRQPY